MTSPHALAGAPAMDPASLAAAAAAVVLTPRPSPVTPVFPGATPPALTLVPPPATAAPAAAAPMPAPALHPVASAAPAIGTVAVTTQADTAAVAMPAPPIGTVVSPVPAPPHAIGTVGPSAEPNSGTAAVALPAPPVIGSVALTPSQQLDRMEDPPAVARVPYAPPTAAIPDAPPPPGKWVAKYTRDMSKYVVPGLDGLRSTETFVRATTHAKVLDDSTALTKWQLRGTVLGLARNPELLDGLDLGGADHVNELTFGSKLALSSVGNAAMRRAGGDDGSDFGTKLHGYVEALIEGVIPFDEVPDLFKPYVRVLFAAVRRHGLNFVRGMTERTVFIPATGMVGTFDFLFLTPHGELIIGDLKTSSSIDYSWLAIGVQLAQYAHAIMMLSWDGTFWEQMPEVSKVYAAVVSVPKDEPSPVARIYYVDLALGAELVDIATRVQGIHETSRRVASTGELRKPGDELIAWAAGDPVTLSEAASMV